MRELKFRAWDKMRNSMDDEVYIFCDGTIHDQAERLYDTPNTEIEQAYDLIIMQSTGLKDKNGVYIFEGDIVESRFFDKSIVSFRDGCFYFDDLPAHQWDDHCGEVDWEWSIVGNIHQNPELMEQSK